MVIVAGGGLSGLTAAYYLTKKYANTNLKLLLIEASKRCGGWVKSTNTPSYLFEAGPRTIRPVGPQGINTLNLIEELDLADRVVPIKRDHTVAKNRMIYAKGRLNMLPSSLKAMLSVNPPFTKPLLTSTILTDLTTKPEYLKDDSLYNFVSRRFGKEVADYAISPMVCGICAGDAKEVSVKFLMSRLFELEQKHGGVVKGLVKNMFKHSDDPKFNRGKLAQRAKNEKWAIYSLEGGLEKLPLKLTEVLFKIGAQICTEHRIESISFFNDNKRVCVKIHGNRPYSSEHIFSCLPAYQLADLLKKDHPALSEELKEIPFVDVAVVNLQYNSDDLITEKGFGFLVPPLEKLPILGVIYDSCCFDGQKGTVLTAMMGGKWFNEYFGSNPSEEELLNTAVDQINKILNVDAKPDAYKVNILKKCIPQYIVGHHDRVKRIREYVSKNKLPLSLCGSSFDGVGVNDVILSSYNAVHNSKIK